MSALIVACVFSLDLHSMHAENGALENVQALTLLLSACIFLGCGLKCGRPLSVELTGLPLLCFSFSLREIDIEQLLLPSDVTQLFTGAGRTTLLLVLWSLYGLWARDQLLQIRSLLRRQIESGLVLFLVAAAALLVAGGVIDRSLVTLAHPRLFEELFEVNAYLFLLAPACFYAKALRGVVSPLAVAPQPRGVVYANGVGAGAASTETDLAS